MYGMFIFIGGLITLSIVDSFVQKNREKRYYKNNIGFYLQREKDKYKILVQEDDDCSLPSKGGGNM